MRRKKLQSRKPCGIHVMCHGCAESGGRSSCGVQPSPSLAAGCSPSPVAYHLHEMTRSMVVSVCRHLGLVGVNVARCARRKPQLLEQSEPEACCLSHAGAQSPSTKPFRSGAGIIIDSLPVSWGSVVQPHFHEVLVLSGDLPAPE